MVNTILMVEGSFYQGSTNIRKLRNTFFSIKNRKFITPCERHGDSVSGYFTYRLYPGTYICFNYYSWSKSDPEIAVSIEVIKLEGLENTYNIDVIKKIEIKCDRRTECVEIARGLGFSKASEVIEDFVKRIPSYHTRPDIKGLSNKVYNEESVKELIDFLNKFNNETLYYKMEAE